MAMRKNRTLTRNREDRRVRRTMRVLEESLTDLLLEKPIQDITVQELTERADINRGTFYLYYQDVFDMLDHIEEDYFDRLVNLLSPEGEEILLDIRTVYERGFTFISENRKLCRVLLGEHGDIAFLQKIDMVLKEKCRGEWRKMSKEADETEFEYVYSFVTSGSLGVIRAWLMRDCKEDPKAMAALVERQLQKGSAAAFQ